jgi:hypothetical protein
MGDIKQLKSRHRRRRYRHRRRHCCSESIVEKKTKDEQSNC